MKNPEAFRHGLGRDARTIVIATARRPNADKVDGEHAVSSRRRSTPARQARCDRREDRAAAQRHHREGPNADLLDGLDSGDLQFTSGGQSGAYPDIDGCDLAPILSYPLEVTRSQVLAAAASGLGVPEGGFKPSILTELVDAQGQLVASSSRVVHTGEGGNWSLSVTEALAGARQQLRALRQHQVRPGAAPQPPAGSRR